MNRLARLSLLPAACAFVAACASAAPHPPRDEPPEMVSRGASPDLQIPTSAMAARTALEVNIEVLIDEQHPVIRLNGDIPAITEAFRQALAGLVAP